MPDDWIYELPHLRADGFAALVEAGYESIRAIPDDWSLSDLQRRVREVLIDGEPFVSDGLATALRHLAPPVHYLDFEYFQPAIPLYPQTRPYQRIPFQYSIHSDAGDGQLRETGFLADGGEDPREPLARHLIEVLGGDEWPIAVYNVAAERSGPVLRLRSARR